MPIEVFGGIIKIIFSLSENSGSLLWHSKYFFATPTRPAIANPISLFPQKLTDQVPRAAAGLSFDVRQNQLL